MSKIMNMTGSRFRPKLNESIKSNKDLNNVIFMYEPQKK